jgi:hypothetical protein
MKLFSRLESINSNSKNYRLYSLLSLLFLFFLILIRNSIYVTTPRFWSEEQLYFETFFHMENWWEGFDALIFPSHYVFLLRVAGLLATFPELEYAPIATTVFGFMILTLPLFILFFTDCKYWDSLQKKIVLSFFLIFSCSTGEVWLTSTNVQALIPVSSFLILLDDNLVSKLKKLIYTIILACAVITGPTTLFMAPFFLLRFIQTKHKQFLSYCLILFSFGVLHLIYFYVSMHVGLDLGGRFSSEFDPIKSFIYITSTSVIFPFFGYFISIIYRTGLDIIHIGLDTIPYLESPNYSALVVKIFPSFMTAGIESIIIALMKIEIFIIGFFFLAFCWIFYYEFKKADFDERAYFLSLYFYLAFLLGALSLERLGGFRYSYLTSFILLFYLYQRLVSNKEKIKRGLIKFLLIFSVVISIFEYYPRTISYSPDVPFGEDAKWPVWPEEVALWKKNSSHLPQVWAGKKKPYWVWPVRDRVAIANLNEPEFWERYGKKKKFSEEFLKILSSK